MNTTNPGVTYQPDDSGVVHVVFDRPGERVNLLTPEILRRLSEILEEIRVRDDVAGVLFRSAKPGMFIAGMDVDAIASVTESFRASEGARLGQSTFQRIADLPVPSACAIGGPCLGGGLELALACSLRLASDDPSVRLGLPEVQLGIIPGFGGTQRLPRLVGLVTALDLILTGRRIDARRARRMGLVDEVVPAAYLERRAMARLLEASRDPSRAEPARKRPWTSTAVERFGPLRGLVLSRARKRTAKRARPSAYPAPFRAIEAVEAAFTLPRRQGLDLEATLVGELVPTPTCRNLIWLFKAQTALRREPAAVTAPPRPVRRAAVIGAGIMGGGISQLLAHREIAVRLKDLQWEPLLAALRTAKSQWDRQVSRRRMSPAEARQRMAFVAPTVDSTGLRQVDVVVEAVVEDLEVKRRVLADVEARVGERAVFASNTSSLPISEIASRALRPERVVGLHFFNPVHRMPLVEVIAGRRSSPEAVATVHALAIRLGKTPVVVRDSPGFLVNRILMAYLNEALHLLREGVTIESADRAMTTFGMPMGPFTLLDEVGLDTAAHVADVLQRAFGERIGEPVPALGSMVAAGRLGAKGGRGFYRYRGGRRAGPDPDARNLAGAPGPKELPPETLQERMVLAMINEASVCLEDGVVREPREVDIGMVMGTGFPPFRGGLLRHADSIGIPMVADRLNRLADAHGGRFRPAGLLREMVRAERRFYPS